MQVSSENADFDRPASKHTRSNCNSDDSGESDVGVLACGSNGHNSEREQDSQNYEETLKVDRRRYEFLIYSSETDEKCERFFQKIMDSTGTQILWPSRLKIGGKNRKDPQIRISGHVDNVEKAKMMVLQRLDTRVNKVTLKIDISHSEHSHIIGKAGTSIKRIMDETKCHIHFPDSNRTSTEEKSNQVSIAGDSFGTEAARKRLREMQQLALTFEVPMTCYIQPPDVMTPVIHKIATSYEISISIDAKNQRCATGTLPFVANTMYTTKGLVKNAEKVKAGTQELIDYLTRNFNCPIFVTTWIDISPQHQATIFGKDNSHIQRIMNKTGAIVNIDQNVRRGALYIQGTIESVYSARQHIIDYLPIVFMFDLHDDADTSQANQLMEDLDCNIQIKSKSKLPNKVVIVKTNERNIAAVYEVRRSLMGLGDDEPNPAGELIAHISYAKFEAGLLASPSHHQQVMGVPHTSSSSFPASCIDQQLYLQLLSAMKNSSIGQQLSLGSLNNQNLYSYILQQHQLLQQQQQQEQQREQLHQLMSQQQMAPNTSAAAPGSSSLLYPGVNPLLGLIEAAGTTKNTVIPNYRQRVHSQPVPSSLDYNNTAIEHREDERLSASSDSSPEKLLYEMSERDFIPEVGACANPSSSSRVRPVLSDLTLDPRRTQNPDASPHVPPATTTTASAQFGKMVASYMSLPLDGATGTSQDESLAGILSSSNNNSTIHDLNNNNDSSINRQLLSDSGLFAAISEYEKKKLLATKQVDHKMLGPEYRVPTDVWSGLGFSRSMPGSVPRHDHGFEVFRTGNVYQAAATDPEAAPINPWLEKEDEIFPIHQQRRVSKHGAPGERLPITTVATTTSSVSATSAIAPGVMQQACYGGSSDAPRKTTIGSTSLRHGFSASNHFDCLSNRRGLFAPPICSGDADGGGQESVAELLTRINLSKYCDLFREQEIDMNTLKCLTDTDLQELGISFGARRRIMLAVSDAAQNNHVPAAFLHTVQESHW